MADAEPLPFHATGLHIFWETRTHRAPIGEQRDVHNRMLLDMLGLGLEQVLTHLGHERPSFAEFLDWILATAGRPDPVQLARYEAAVTGAPMPRAARARLAAIDAMAPVLGSDDIEHWQQMGFVILREAITPAQADAAAALLWKVSHARADDPDSWYSTPRAKGVWVPIYQHPALEAARRSPRVHKAFAQLWGTSDLWMIVDRMSFNPPERPGNPFYASRLHWDVSLARPIPFATQAILYLTDTSEDQGALELVPGFHHRIDAWLDGSGKNSPRNMDLGAETVRIAAGAGDLIIWRQDLPHGVTPNSSNRPRLAQYVNMYPPTLQSHAEWI